MLPTCFPSGRLELATIGAKFFSSVAPFACLAAVGRKGHGGISEVRDPIAPSASDPLKATKAT
jgi:hypothetical protein